MTPQHSNTNPQPPAVIYCRVSGAKQATAGHGLDSQESRCRDHAARQGYHVEAVFPDDVSGGGDFMKRPGMVALLSYLDAQKDKSYIVIFDDLKRFARDTEFHIQLRRAFKQRGAQVECLNFQFEDTPEGKFHETIVAAHGELEREQNRRQSIQKTKARLEAGYNTFPPPVGYTWGKVAPPGKLYVRKEPLASIVTEALEGFATGRFASQAEVQRFLEDQPAFPKASGGRVRPQRVTDILTRSVYAGFVEHAPWGVTRRKGHHAPLISAELFQRIQDMRAGRAKITKRADLGQDFILRGAVLCAECDAPYRSAWSKGKYKHYAYYVCQTKTCESYGKSIPRAQVENAFEDILKDIAPASSMITIARKMFRKIWDTRVAQAKAQGRAIKQELKALETRMQKTLDRIVGADSAAVANALEQKYNDMELQRAVLAEKAAIPSSNSHHFNEKLELSLQFLANPWKIWQNGSFDLRRTVLKLVLTHPFRYHRETGPRTPEISFPFNALSENFDQFGQMVRMRRLELPRVLPHSDLNAARLPFRHIRTL